MRSRLIADMIVVVIGCLGVIMACSKTNDNTPPEAPPAVVAEVEKTICIMASWYNEGKETASGEPFKPLGLTAAHKTLPFNTMLKIINPTNRKTVEVRVNDRGPYIKGRELDISEGAARAIDFTERGVGTLCYVKLG